MARTSKHNWTEEDKVRLINCSDRFEMVKLFPMYTEVNLYLLKRKFAKEMGIERQGKIRKGSLPKVVIKKQTLRHDMEQTSHLVIPDTQMKQGVPDDHLRWIGQYIVDRQPDVIIHLGDHWDMPSLSEYDKGKKQFEGRRYRQDVEAGNDAFALLNEAMKSYNRKNPGNEYNPRKVFCLGNHCDRIERQIETNAVLDGVISYNDLDFQGWEVQPYLEPIWIDGIAYCHYFYNPMSGRPYGGQVATRLKTIGHTFTMGHQQTLDYSIRFVGGKSQHGLVAGACYIHDEEYKGPQGNSHWRGIIVKHDVDDGQYNPMFVDLNYLCRRYEDMRLDEYIDNYLIRPNSPEEAWRRK